jgi:hypothetical protein
MKNKKTKNRNTLKHLSVSQHRRVIAFLNEATRAEDLMFEKLPMSHFENAEGAMIVDEQADMKRKPRKIMDAKTAKEIIGFRDREFPLGFRHINELKELKLDLKHIRDLLHLLSESFYGSWENFSQPILRRGPGSYDGIVHAAMLHTGQVLFITADETTLLWDPEDTSPATFENPVNQPYTMPDGYSQLCGHHVLLSDGKLLSVGGGGYGPNPAAHWGFKFDPVAKSWARTTGSMSMSRWYPTATRLGDHRILNNSQVLITCGHGGGDMEIYDETMDTFSEITSGDTKLFPSLYPGLHLLPSHNVFYTRTGWGGAGPDGGPFTGDDQSAYFSFTGDYTGVWNNIATAPPSIADRTKGMSVMLLSNTCPHVRILVIGGADPARNDSYEILDASTLSPLSNWGPRQTFPDGEHRSLASAVLLPDGNVFVCGGIQRVNSPCAMFDPKTNTWSGMATLPSIRDYHSAAILLPGGKVMMAGWNNTTIEIFSPPYLFKGARPAITSAPASVSHGADFTIATPDAASIVKAVMVRPMAITHQTDGEQRVLEMFFLHDHVHPNNLITTAPTGGTAGANARRGYYMLFLLNNKGVPSVARWIYLS